MSPLCLSTMYARADYLDGDWHAFAGLARDAGCSHVEASHVTDEPGLHALAEIGEPPLISLHAPTPRERVNGRWNSELNLASTDEHHRRLAVTHHLRTLQRAVDVGARWVVVHLGGAGDDMYDEERELRRRFDAGRWGTPDIDRLREAARARRAASRPRAFAQARRSLAELLAEARRLSITIGIENRYHFHEIPDPDETASLLREFAASPVGYWHDVGHAEVLHRLGFHNRSRWLQELLPDAVGIHLHDVLGIGDHRAPGRGDVDWAPIAAALPAEAVRTLEIAPGEPRDAVLTAAPLLRARGVLVR